MRGVGAVVLVGGSVLAHTTAGALVATFIAFWTLGGTGTTTYTFSGKNVTVNVDQVNAQDQKVHIEYTATLDGADNPWTGTIDGKPNPGQDAVSFKKLDAHTYHVENKLKGKVLTTNHIVVAPDGKSRTVTITGTNAAGQKLHHVVVYEKQ